MAYDAADPLGMHDAAVVFPKAEFGKDIAGEHGFCEAFFTRPGFFNLTDAGAKHADRFDFRQNGCSNMFAFCLRA